ncbi:MAG: FKBP-type peptidyl-prolyl cis-trans isomerase [Minisyncoccia bacterium]
MSKEYKTQIAVAVAVVVAVLFFSGAVTWLNIGGDISASSVNEQSINNANNISQENTMENSNELKIEDVVVGTGAEATAGKSVTVNYTGKFTNGTVFDSSIPRGTPFTFTLGAGMVIPGWDMGVAGMKVGGKRILTIPSDLAYGPNDYQSIPGGSTLIFEVDLLEVK